MMPQKKQGLGDLYVQFFGDVFSEWASAEISHAENEGKFASWGVGVIAFNDIWAMQNPAGA